MKLTVTILGRRVAVLEARVAELLDEAAALRERVECLSTVDSILRRNGLPAVPRPRNGMEVLPGGEDREAVAAREAYRLGVEAGRRRARAEREASEAPAPPPGERHLRAVKDA